MTRETTRKIIGKSYIWQLPEIDQEYILPFSSKYNISPSLMQVLFSRGYTNQEQIDSFLFTTLEKDVAHPILLKDCEKAVERIIFAINNQEKILICGDYDVDGITSSSLMMICLLPLGAKVNFFLPNRIRDGYGLSVNTVKKASQNGYKVLITVDNGITAFEPAKLAKQLNIDLIVTDHHKPHSELPDAFAVIDPCRDDCSYPFKKLAGVGVSFKVMSLLYEKLGLEMPSRVYELLLLGTIADVVPLVGENRFWVRHGLHLVNNAQESAAVKVLKKNSRVEKPVINSQDIGFFLTPQINALGRLEDPRDGVKFLLSHDQQIVEEIGSVLKTLNEARKAIEKSVLDDVISHIQSKKIDLDKDRIIVACSNDWPPGVIGLVASRLVGMFNRPAILLHTKSGLAKGSCRSVPQFNIFDALEANKDILVSFGGHAMAAGLAIDLDNLELFKERLNQLVISQIPEFEPKRTIILEGHISLPDLTKKFMKDMTLLEPFGQENSQPVFYLENISLLGDPVLLKEVHVKCKVFADGIIKPVIFFNQPDVYNLLLENKDKSFRLAVQATENYWEGKSTVELQGLDIAL